MPTSMNHPHQETENQFNSLVTDVASMRSSIIGITAKLDTAISTLNAAGTNLATVAGTNFGALWNPAALGSVAGT